MVVLNELLEERRIARMRFTKREKTFVNSIYDAEQVDRDDPQGHQHFMFKVRALQPQFEQLSRDYQKLQDIQEQVDYNAEYHERLEQELINAGKEEEDERKYNVHYSHASAKLQQLNDEILPAKAERDEGSDHGSVSADQLLQTLKNVFKEMNFGIGGDELKQILENTSAKKKKIDIPKFKGKKELKFYDTWRDLITAEIEKPIYTNVERTFLIISLLDGDARTACTVLKDPTHIELLAFLDSIYGDVAAKIQKAVLDISNMDNVKETEAELNNSYTTLLSSWNYLLKKTPENESTKKSSWILTSMVLPKLPKRLVEKWDDDRQKEAKEKNEPLSVMPMSFEELLVKLFDALQLARRQSNMCENTTTTPVATSSSRGRNQHPLQQQSQQQQNRPYSSRPTGHMLGASMEHQQNSRSHCCKFCTHDHPTGRCTNCDNLTIERRRQLCANSDLCFNCLRYGHYAVECEARGCKNCNGYHHTLLCYQNNSRSSQQPQHGRQSAPSADKKPEPKKAKAPEKKPENAKPDVQQPAGNIVSAVESANVLLPSAIVKLESNSTSVRGRVLFDSGCGSTLISTKYAKKLNLRGPRFNCLFKLVGGRLITRQCMKVRFILSSVLPDFTNESFEIVAYVLEKPAADLQAVTIPIKEHKHLSDLTFTENFPRDSCEIDVMLSVVDSMRILQSERRDGPANTPGAMLSHIGWVVYGSYSSDDSHGVDLVTSCATALLSSCYEDVDQDPNIEQYWELEYLGIKSNEKQNQKRTPLEEEALKQHNEKTRFNESERHYESGLLIHPDYKDVNIDSNKRPAKMSLYRLEKMLAENPELCQKYCDQILEMLVKDRAEHCENSQPEPKNAHYLTHKPVIRAHSITTDVRMVMDGSRKTKDGISLNDILLPGEPLQPDQLGLFIRFRGHIIIFIADIEKMFLAIKIRLQDRDMQRFLWRNMEVDRPIETYRLTGVTFGLTCSPYTAIQTVSNHIETQMDTFPQAASEMRKNIFVDDILSGGETVEEVRQLSSDMRDLLKNGGFRLRKFLSNRPEALEHLDPEDLTSHHVENFDMNTYTTKILGVQYAPKDDVMTFNFSNKIEHHEVDTRRSMLSDMLKIYDLQGLLSPFTIKAKQLLQLSWLAGGEWDDQLPLNIQKPWLEWKNSVHELDSLSVPRCFIPEHFSKYTISLHGFGDACEASYGTIIYARVENSESGEVHISPLVSKTCVAPLRHKRGIHELELMAALLTSRLITYTREQLDNKNIESIQCWTDSKVTLEWIRQPAYVWQTFVSNRVGEIHKLVTARAFKHIAGKLNPADLCSRGISAKQLVNSELWWNGPNFLTENTENWPTQPELTEETSRMADGKKKKNIFSILSETFATTCTATENTNTKSDTKQPMSFLKRMVFRYESYGKFIGVMTNVRKYVFKLLERARIKIQMRKSGLDTIPDEGSKIAKAPGLFGIEERRTEELFWIKWAQNESFATEIKMLKNGQSVLKDSKLKGLNPYIDDKGLLRVGGRLNLSLLSDESRNPIILPTHNPLVELFVLYYHRVHCHTGTSQTVSNLRVKYWLVHGRQEARRIVHNCLKCKQPKTMEQKMAPLPLERITVSDTFCNIGTDFAGPFYVTAPGNNVQLKVYLALFVDMASRGLHLESTESQNADDFLKALQRMCNRRGRCSLILSDNAKAFKKSATVLKNLFKSKNLKIIGDALRAQGIEWRFITERAPWHGGMYERFVQSVKGPLKKILGKAKLSLCEFQTVITDIEAQVNSRPLNSVSSDKEDPMPITPAHILIGRNLQTLPDLNVDIRDIDIGKRWQYRQRLQQTFWTKWRKDYLPSLMPYKKWYESHPNAEPGQVVLVKDESSRKLDWLLGRVESVQHGRDNLVRSVSVKTKKGLLRRPVQKLALLECSK